MAYDLKSDRVAELTDFGEDRDISQARTYGEVLEQMRSIDSNKAGYSMEVVEGYGDTEVFTVDGDPQKARDWFMLRNAISGGMEEDFDMEMEEVNQNVRLLNEGEYDRMERIIEYASEGDL